MARRKKPEGETPDQATIRRQKESISNASSRSEKTSWNRKMDNMVRFMAELRPIERQIVELQNQKIPIFDKIQALREVMVSECVHPFEYLVKHEDHVRCKFCEKRMRLPVVTPNASTDEKA